MRVGTLRSHANNGFVRVKAFYFGLCGLWIGCGLYWLECSCCKGKRHYGWCAYSNGDVLTIHAGFFRVTVFYRKWRLAAAERQSKRNAKRMKAGNGEGA